MPLGAERALRFEIVLGIASSGARGSPFLPQANASVRQIIAPRNNPFIASSILSIVAPRFYARFHPTRAAGRPPHPLKDNRRRPFLSCPKSGEARPVTTLRCAWLWSCKTAPPCPPLDERRETAARGRPDNPRDPWRS